MLWKVIVFRRATAIKYRIQEKRELYQLLKSFPVNEDDDIIEYIKTKSHSIPLIVTRLNKIVKLRSQSYPSSTMDLDPDRLWLWYIWHGLTFSENWVSLWTYNIVVERWLYNVRVIECIDFHIFTWFSLAFLYRIFNWYVLKSK